MFRLYALYVCSLVLETSALQLQMDDIPAEGLAEECQVATPAPAEVLAENAEVLAENEISFTVIGNSGAGKSTLLNAFIDIFAESEEQKEELYFATEASSEPCTKEISGKVINVTSHEDWGDFRTVRLIDTPEWWDKHTYDDVAADFHSAWVDQDSTTDAKNPKPINPLSKPKGAAFAHQAKYNVLVWVVKSDRGSDELTWEEYTDQKNKTLFFEQILKQPQWNRVFLVISGRENYNSAAGKKHKKLGTLEQEREKVRTPLRPFAKKLKEKFNLNDVEKDIFVSSDGEDFLGSLVPCLLRESFKHAVETR